MPRIYRESSLFVCTTFYGKGGQKRALSVGDLFFYGADWVVATTHRHSDPNVPPTAPLVAIPVTLQLQHDMHGPIVSLRCSLPLLSQVWFLLTRTVRVAANFISPLPRLAHKLRARTI